MNDLLKDFADDADHAAMEPGQEYNMHRFAERFSELIIQECIACLSMQLGQKYTPEEMLFQAKYRKEIKHRFGIEE